MSNIHDVIEEFRSEGYSKFILEVGPGFDSHPIELARENKDTAIIAVDVKEVRELIKNALDMDESSAATINLMSSRPQEEKIRVTIEMVSRTREFLAEHERHANLKYVQADITKTKEMKIESELFTSIYLHGVMLQKDFFDGKTLKVAIVKEVLEELSKTLKPGGFIDISEMFGATKNSIEVYMDIKNFLGHLGLEVKEIPLIITYGHYLAYLRQKDIAMDELFKRIRATKKET